MTLYLATGSEHDGLVLIIFQTEGRKQDREEENISALRPETFMNLLLFVYHFS